METGEQGEEGHAPAWTLCAAGEHREGMATGRPGNDGCQTSRRRQAGRQLVKAQKQELQLVTSLDRTGDSGRRGLRTTTPTVVRRLFHSCKHHFPGIHSALSSSSRTPIAQTRRFRCPTGELSPLPIEALFRTPSHDQVRLSHERQPGAVLAVAGCCSPHGSMCSAPPSRRRAPQRPQAFVDAWRRELAGRHFCVALSPPPKAA